MTPTPERNRTYAAFWPFYLGQHSRSATRALHYAGSLAAIALLVAAAITSTWWLTAAAVALPDTDWHIPELYDFLEELDASVIIASHSRYYIDLNRDPDGKTLYPGASNTELCPTTTFAGS